MELILHLHRRFKGSYTIGSLFIDGKYFCDTLEDQVRILPDSCPNTPKGRACVCKEKVYGETAILAGKYKVVLRYSPKFKRILPAIEDVAHFLGILFHSGTTAADSHGCILLGENKKRGMLLNSKATVDLFISILKSAVEAGKTLILIID